GASEGAPVPPRESADAAMPTNHAKVIKFPAARSEALARRINTAPAQQMEVKSAAAAIDSEPRHSCSGATINPKTAPPNDSHSQGVGGRKTSAPGVFSAGGMKPSIIDPRSTLSPRCGIVSAQS